MPKTPMNRVIQHLLAACGGDGAGLTDGELLTRFLNSRDDAALAALVRRHGSMVYAVCRRRLCQDADADDAFQTVFMLLFQKANDPLFSKFEKFHQNKFAYIFPEVLLVIDRIAENLH